MPNHAKGLFPNKVQFPDLQGRVRDMTMENPQAGSTLLFLAPFPSAVTRGLKPISENLGVNGLFPSTNHQL